MVQTVCSYKILAGKKKIVLEKPISLHRIFFSIDRVANQTSWHTTMMSFGDPLFRSYFVLNGPVNHFQAEGVDIFQGDIWIFNNSDTDFWYSVTEILR